MFWGNSESFDFFGEYKKVFDEEVEELNILSFGTSDPRNILHTISMSYKHPVKLNFYLIDACSEITARNMLLLALAFETPEILSLRNKTQLYMDIYGNSLLRPFTNCYISSKSEVLQNVITNEDANRKITPVFNYDYLKYREKDNLLNTFEFWLPKENHIFNISRYWENRNRQSLGIRYDHKEGVFDWDLKMNLNDAGVKNICSQEYRHWRETGIAFTFPEYEQCEPNKSLVAGIVRNGQKFCHRGYIGDQEIGPFCAHGLTCSRREMLRETYGIFDFRATDITEVNLYEILHGIQEKKDYVFDKSHCHQLGACTLLLTESFSSTPSQQLGIKQYKEPSLELENVSIKFLSADFLTSLHHEGHKFTELFHAVFIPHNYFAMLKHDLKNVLQKNAIIFFETKQYTLLRPKNKAGFLQEIKNFASDINLKNITNFNLNINFSIVKYKTGN